MDRVPYWMELLYWASYCFFAVGLFLSISARRRMNKFLLLGKRTEMLHLKVIEAYLAGDREAYAVHMYEFRRAIDEIKKL